MSCELINESNVLQLLNSFDHVLTDCDGVLYHGNNAIEGAALTLNKLRQLGKDVFFVTNNSTKSRSEFLQKYHSLGFEAKEEEVFSTSYAAAAYLKTSGFNKTVYVVGSKGITQELDLLGIQHTGEGPDVLKGNLVDWILDGISLDPEVGAVIVGFDSHLSYPKILKAATYINNPGCMFLGTNTDERFPSLTSNVIIPGSGSILAAVKTAAGKEPILLGKPQRYLFDSIASQHKIDPSRTLMIGDTLSTDILFGSNCGLKSLLVLTGISSLDEVRSFEKSSNIEDYKLVPSFYIDSLGTLGRLIK